MRTVKILYLLPAYLILVQSCSNDGTNKKSFSPPDLSSKNRISSELITSDWDCPDNKDFPPVDIKSWKEVQVVNGRLPTFEETQNGTSLLYIDKSANPHLQEAKPYNIVLPKLAYHTNPRTKKEEIVVVIQIVEFSNYTWVGYRYLTGGNGSSDFKNFRFLTEDEIGKVVV